MDEYEVEIPVEVVQVHRQCAECVPGRMLPTDMVLTTYPAQYPHKCNECDAGETFMCRYPKLEYRDKYKFK